MNVTHSFANFADQKCFKSKSLGQLSDNSANIDCPLKGHQTRRKADRRRYCMQRSVEKVLLGSLDGSERCLATFLRVKNMKLDNPVAHSVEAARCDIFSSYTLVCLTLQLKVHS